MLCDRHCVACAVLRVAGRWQARLDFRRRLAQAARLDVEVRASQALHKQNG